MRTGPGALDRRSPKGAKALAVTSTSDIHGATRAMRSVRSPDEGQRSDIHLRPGPIAPVQSNVTPTSTAIWRVCFTVMADDVAICDPVELGGQRRGQRRLHFICL